MTEMGAKPKSTSSPPGPTGSQQPHHKTSSAGCRTPGVCAPAFQQLLTFHQPLQSQGRTTQPRWRRWRRCSVLPGEAPNHHVSGEPDPTPSAAACCHPAAHPPSPLWTSPRQTHCFSAQEAVGQEIPPEAFTIGRTQTSACSDERNTCENLALSGDRGLRQQETLLRSIQPCRRVGQGEITVPGPQTSILWAEECTEELLCGCEERVSRGNLLPGL